MLDDWQKSSKAKYLEQLNHFLPDSQFLQNIGGLYSTSVGEVRFSISDIPFVFLFILWYYITSRDESIDIALTLLWEADRNGLIISLSFVQYSPSLFVRHFPDRVFFTTKLELILWLFIQTSKASQSEIKLFAKVVEEIKINLLKSS